METIELLLSQLKTTTPQQAFKSRVEKLLVPQLPKASVNMPMLLVLRYGLIVLLLFLVSSGGLVYATINSKPGNVLFGIKAKFLPNVSTETQSDTPSESNDVLPTPSNQESGQNPANTTPTLIPTSTPSGNIRIQLTIPRDELLPLLQTDNTTLTPTPISNPQPTTQNPQLTPTPISSMLDDVEISLSSPTVQPTVTTEDDGLSVGIGGVNVNIGTPNIGILGL